MKIIDLSLIKTLNIAPSDYIEWARNAFLLKKSSYIPPKISIKTYNRVVFSAAPCIIPDINRFGVKTMSRYPRKIPPFTSEVLLFDYTDGNPLALIDAQAITTMRSGAVAALTAGLLQKEGARVYSFIGLGNTARAVFLCLQEFIHTPVTIRLFDYQDHAQLFMERFKEAPHIQFEIVYTYQDLIEEADVIISCTTALENAIGRDEWFKEGVLVIPVRTKGFQNCDVFFDKVFTDYKNHIKYFKNYEDFKAVCETGDALKRRGGRESAGERIIAYNMGIGLHDIYAASRVYDLAADTAPSVDFFDPAVSFLI